MHTSAHVQPMVLYALSFSAWIVVSCLLKWVIVMQLLNDSTMTTSLGRALGLIMEAAVGTGTDLRAVKIVYVLATETVSVRHILLFTLRRYRNYTVHY